MINLFRLIIVELKGSLVVLFLKLLIINVSFNPFEIFYS